MLSALHLLPRYIQIERWSLVSLQVFTFNTRVKHFIVMMKNLKLFNAKIIQIFEVRSRRYNNNKSDAAKLKWQDVGP